VPHNDYNCTTTTATTIKPLGYNYNNSTTTTAALNHLDTTTSTTTTVQLLLQLNYALLQQLLLEL